MRPKLPRKVRSPDGRYRAHIITVYYISRPPLSLNPLSAPEILSILPFSLASLPSPKAAASYSNSHTLFHRVKLYIGFLSFFRHGKGGRVQIVILTSILCFNKRDMNSDIGGRANPQESCINNSRGKKERAWRLMYKPNSLTLTGTPDKNTLDIQWLRYNHSKTVAYRILAWTFSLKIKVSLPCWKFICSRAIVHVRRLY